MLLELSIDNLALFERATVSFGPGLNVITGETGAGKSLLIDALELLLGERPKVSMVRQGADEARVEGRFVLSYESTQAHEIRTWFTEHLPHVPEAWAELAQGDERELILCRALSSVGKTRAWVDHRPVTQRVLRELAALMVEIHGQNEHQKLLQAGEQARLLDAYGEVESILTRYRETRTTWMSLADEATLFERRSRERRDRLDLLRFQARELAEAKLSVDEHAELVNDRERLRHANEIARDLGGVAGELMEGEASALDVVKRALKAVERWEARLTELTPHAEGLRAAVSHLDEACDGLARTLARVEPSPARLEEIEDRLYHIEILAKKYRTDVAGLVVQSKELSSALASVESQGDDFEALLVRTRAARDEVEAAANALTKARTGVIARLAKDVKKHLAELGLERATFQVRIAPRSPASVESPNVSAVSAVSMQSQADRRRFGADGADEIEFLLAANPGEEAQPLRLVASGGETARIMLALRTVLAVRQTIPTLVFDEIDSGVGGRLGPKVGEHLRELAARHQILCVTHLPAIAALAHHHFQVAKAVVGGRTRTAVQALTGDARVQEIADMIAGGAEQATARAEAQRLLGAAKADVQKSGA